MTYDPSGLFNLGWILFALIQGSEGHFLLFHGFLLGFFLAFLWSFFCFTSGMLLAVAGGFVANVLGVRLVGFSAASNTVAEMVKVTSEVEDDQQQVHQDVE